MTNVKVVRNWDTLAVYQKYHNTCSWHNKWHSQDGSVSTATRYWLDDPRIISWWCKIFCAIQTGAKAQLASHTTGTGSLTVVKQPQCGANHPPPSSATLQMARSYPPSLHCACTDTSWGDLYLYYMTTQIEWAHWHAPQCSNKGERLLI